MTRRMIDDSMWSNERFAEMPMGARLLQIGVINHADDQGRMKANPVYLRAQIFPYDDIAPGQIQEWLNIMADNDTIILYEADGRAYLQLLNWWKYQSLQYAQPSQFPRPVGWKDRIRKTLTKGYIVTCNWLKVNGEPLEDTCDMDGNALPGRRPKKDSSEPTPDSGTDGSPENAEKNTVDSGEHSAESSAKGSIELNLTKLNKNKTTTKTTDAPEPVVGKSGSGGRSGGGLSRDGDKDYADICDAVEKNGFGMMTEIVADQIADMLKEYPKAWILDAMRVAVSNNKRKLSYVSGVLTKWRAEGRDGKAAQPTPATRKPERYIIKGALYGAEDREITL